MDLIAQDKQESSAVPGSESCPDCGSLLMPIGELDEFVRRPLRSTDTKDLSARLRSDGRPGGAGRVLNLGEGGMLVESPSDLQVGETVGLELRGPDFRSAGHGAVRADGSIGLRFVTWDSPIERPLHALVAARLRGQQLGSHRAGSLLTGRLMAWDAREHERAAVGGLSVLIETSPAATTRRHRVLNVDEHGMLITGLALPVGAQISCVLSGRGLNRAGCARVAHRTHTSAGVALAHRHGLPQAIRALVRVATARGPRPEHPYVTDWS